MYGGKAATVCIYVLTWLRVKQGVSGEIHRFYLALKRESKHAVIECKTGLRSPNASHNGVKSFQKWRMKFIYKMFTEKTFIISS